MTWPRMGGRRQQWAAALGLTALLVACPEPEFDYGRPCSGDSDCPDGYRCARVLEGPSNGVCVTEASDAGRTEGGTDTDVGTGFDRALADAMAADQQAPADSASTPDTSATDGVVLDGGSGSDATVPALRRLDQTRALYPSYGALAQASLRLEGRVVAGGQATLQGGSLILHGRLSVVAP